MPGSVDWSLDRSTGQKEKGKEIKYQDKSTGRSIGRLAPESVDWFLNQSTGKKKKEKRIKSQDQSTDP